MDEKILNDILQRVNDVSQAVDTIRQDVGTLKKDVGTLKEDVGTLKQDVKKIEKTQNRHTKQLSELQSTVNKWIISDIARLERRIEALENNSKAI